MAFLREIRCNVEGDKRNGRRVARQLVVSKHYISVPRGDYYCPVCMPMVSAIRQVKARMDLSLLFLHRQVLARRSSVEGPPKLPFAGLRPALTRVFADSSGAFTVSRSKSTGGV